MPPLPGKIQTLPIKVLYTIDTSPQSFLVVLPQKENVYVHPSNTATGNGDLIGSCTLKSVVRGICYASPECVPNQASLDFSVYNLDPVPRPLVARAFPAPVPIPASWTGKGFLSWALAESGDGKTLARGRLVREYEFSSTCFAGGGGLEGLVAAANTADGEEKDGRGWGLEVTLTLRQLNPEGKNEFAGRKQFDTMLEEGKSTASAPLSVTSPARPPPPPPPQNGFARPNMPAPKPHPQSSPLRPSKPPTIAPRPAALPPARPPATAISAPAPRASVAPAPAPPRPPPKTQSRAVSKSTPPSRVPAPPSSPTPTRTRPQPEVRTPPSRARDRAPDRTPPARPTGPSVFTTPQPSPTRATLIKLLKCEGKMSPEMAHRLANNSFLQRIMKALPPGEVDKAAASPGARPKAFPSDPVVSGPGPFASAAPASASSASAGTPQPESLAPTPSCPEMCFNCNTTDTVGSWMRKKFRDGTSGLVCNPCGMYFNNHKVMRPRELCENSTNLAPAPPAPVRSSPRLQRKHEGPIPPAESPRKRARRNAPPPSPSPRRSTRAAAREAERSHDEGAKSPTPGGHNAAPLGFSSHYELLGSAGTTPRARTGPTTRASAAATPNNLNDASTAVASGLPLPIAGLPATGAMAAAPLLDPNATATAEELESLFLQFADEDAAPPPSDAPHEPLSLDNLFGGGDTESIMELLRSIEASSEAPEPMSEAPEGMEEQTHGYPLPPVGTKPMNTNE